MHDRPKKSDGLEVDELAARDAEAKTLDFPAGQLAELQALGSDRFGA